ncbi:MAG: hypothetical protein M3Z10_01880, partial [Gemmatimonadota bacterium]|nr:hypothetical protein [Gemmatimonadota bacterium]
QDPKDVRTKNGSVRDAHIANGHVRDDALVKAGDSPTIDEEAQRDAESADDGVFAITRNTDYWFEREVGDIEKNAREQATAWAQQGLPRHDLARTEPFEPEQVMAARCGQLFRDWHRRVKTKMQDAIESASQEVGRQVAVLRNSITQLEAIRSESGDLKSRIVRLRAESERDAGRPVRYGRFVSPAFFWAAAAMLAVVEFFANFPVFRLMLPMSHTLSAAAQDAAGNIDDRSLWAGPVMLGHEMLMHFEATVVALVAVIILVLLGKSLGGAVRPLLAFHEKEYPLAADTIRAHRRQSWALFGASVVGIACVLSFLYMSRGGIAGIASERVATQRASIDSLVAQSNTPGIDRTRLASILPRIDRAQKTQVQLEDDAAYAKTVQQNNGPILGLNLGLIFTAIILGFCYKAEDLNDTKGEHPEITAARERLSELDKELFGAVDAGRNAESLAFAGISRVQHLLRANPLRESKAKLRRLEGVIPLFRGENARLRGLDPANIRAFEHGTDLGLTVIEEDETFREPAEFARLGEELSSLRAEFVRVVPTMTPAFGHPAVE